MFFQYLVNNAPYVYRLSSRSFLSFSCFVVYKIHPSTPRSINTCVEQQDGTFHSGFNVLYFRAMTSSMSKPPGRSHTCFEFVCKGYLFTGANMPQVNLYSLFHDLSNKRPFKIVIVPVPTQECQGIYVAVAAYLFL